ncbi:hypothetical protein ACGYKB_18740 [Sulfitobacter sp. 916]
MIVVLGAIGMALVFLFVGIFLARNPVGEGAHLGLARPLLAP